MNIPLRTTENKVPDISGSKKEIQKIPAASKDECVNKHETLLFPRIV